MVLCLMITRIRQWPELQMRKIKQNFMLTRQRLPKETASFSCALPPFLESSLFSGGLSEENVSKCSVPSTAFFKESGK